MDLSEICLKVSAQNSTAQSDLVLHSVPEKTLKFLFFYFLNNSVENEPILIIFGTLNPEGT